MLSRIVAVCALLALAGTALAAQRPVPADLPELLIERPWLDQVPKEKLQSLRAYFFIPERFEGAYAAIFLDARDFRVTTELLNFDVEGGKTIAFRVLSGGEKVKSSFVIQHEQHGEFDLVLKLGTDPGRRGSAQVYYSKTEWEDSRKVPSVLLPLLTRAGLPR